MQYRRDRTAGGTFFFTVVKHKRRNILCAPENVNLLKDVLKNIKKRHPFEIDAFVLLPDHLHCIWTLPDGDRDFSKRWRLIKSYFTRGCDKRYKLDRSHSRQGKKEQAIWQRRFWEHRIRDDGDMIRHVEYIHYNPVKHGLVKSPGEWAHSSFHRYVKEGIYCEEWGANEALSFDANVGNE